MAMGVVYFLLKFNNILEQIVILDLICHFHRRIESVVFILAAFDFSYEAYGFQIRLFSTEITDCEKMVIVIM